MHLALAETALPARIRLARPLTEEELMAFCARNESVRVERDSNGELIVMSPTGLEGSSWNSELTTELTLWARRDGRGKAFDSNGGFTLPDGSMRSPDAAWVSFRRWNALPREEQKRFGRIVPESWWSCARNRTRCPRLRRRCSSGLTTASSWPG